jgi:hypothetical protein
MQKIMTSGEILTHHSRNWFLPVRKQMTTCHDMNHPGLFTAIDKMVNFGALFKTN